MVKSFRDLDVWHLSVELAETVYRVTARFPKSELFALTAQMRRAAVSIPSNIAEGRARDSTREFLHFLAISRGSLAELETQLEAYRQQLAVLMTRAVARNRALKSKKPAPRSPKSPPSKSRIRLKRRSQSRRPR